MTKTLMALVAILFLVNAVMTVLSVSSIVPPIPECLAAFVGVLVAVELVRLFMFIGGRR